MIKPDSNKCVLQDGQSDVRLYQQKLTMASVNSTELITKAYSYKNTLLETSTYISLNISFDIFTLLEKLVSVTYSLY